MLQLLQSQKVNITGYSIRRFGNTNLLKVMLKFFMNHLDRIIGKMQ